MSETAEAGTNWDLYVQTVPVTLSLAILSGLLGLGWLSFNEAMAFLSGVVAMHAGVGLTRWFA